MKKAIFLLTIAAGFVAAACQKDEIGSTATVALAGEWYVTVDAINAQGETRYTDPFKEGRFKLNTYNTAANTATKMYIDAYGSPQKVYKVQVNCDVETLSFYTDAPVPSESSERDVTVEDGKILPGAATTPHGTPADSIVFYVTFSDDKNLGTYYDKLKVSGYRYTGFASDDE